MAPVTPKQRLYFMLGLLLLVAAMLTYSLTWCFVWDEGFHLVAAQLIASGKTPYIDFCFPQTPLNAYLNAALMLAFGFHWRVVHTFATLYICAAVFLSGDFVLTRLPPQMWRLACAFTTVALFGLNTVLMQYGPTGQAYALAMLMATGAFRAAIRATKSRLPWFAFATGVLAGAAAGSTLLSSPAAPILLLWLWFCNRSGARVLKALLFLAGCAVPFTPVILLFLRAPQQTLFNVIRYQALFRRVNWGDAAMQDVDALTSWLGSPDAIVLAALGASALIFLVTQAKAENPLLEKQQRAEFLLAASLAVAMTVFIAVAHPTFERYFILTIPFFSMVGGLGLWALGARIATPQHAVPAAAVVIGLAALIWGRALFDERDVEHWSDYEEVSAKVAEVTPIGARLYADELVFFILQRTPPAGLEFSYAERLELPAAQENLYHIISSKKLKQQVKAGQFATLQTCKDSLIEDFEPAKSFQHHVQPSDCDIFWGPKKN